MDYIGQKLGHLLWRFRKTETNQPILIFPWQHKTNDSKKELSGANWMAGHCSRKNEKKKEETNTLTLVMEIC